MTDIGPETVARYAPTTAEDWRGMAGGIYAKMRRETNGGYVNFSDYEALAARLAEWQASQHYSYIGRDGKPVLARDLEDRLIAAEAEVARLKTEQGAAAEDSDPPCIDCDDTGFTHQTERFCSCSAGRALAQGDPTLTALDGITPEALLDLLGEFGREVHYMLDDCETSGPVGDETHTITAEGLTQVGNLLDRIEALPFEEPGYILGPGAMLQAAIKQTFIPRDPAVLAVDPMVGALIGAVIEEAAKALFDWLGSKDDALMEARIEATIADFAEDSRQMDTMICHVIRALRPDAAASLARMLRDAENRGLERAAAVADDYERRWNATAYDRRLNGKVDNFACAAASASTHIGIAIRNLKEPTDDQA